MSPEELSVIPMAIRRAIPMAQWLGSPGKVTSHSYGYFYGYSYGYYYGSLARSLQKSYQLFLWLFLWQFLLLFLSYSYGSLAGRLLKS